MANSFQLLQNYRFRVIITRGFNGPQNMAVDEVLLEGGREGEATLRFYDWQPPTLSLGYFQRLSPQELEQYRRQGIPLVRRPTGGRAVYHHDEITYSVILPLNGSGAKTWSPTYYAAVSFFLLRGLVKLGIKGGEIKGRERNKPNGKKGGDKKSASTPWCFESKNFAEISVGGKKLVGSAQRLYPQGLLQHGSIIRDIAPESANQFWGPRGRDGKLTVTSLKEILGRKPDIIKMVNIYTGILQELGIKWHFSSLTGEEQELAAQLAREKYQRLDWPLESGVRSQGS